MMKTLKLSKELYSLINIEETIDVYDRLANIEILHRNNCYLLSFSGCRYDTNRTIKEFENYLIGLENS